MICNFCKCEIKQGAETKILPPDEEIYRVCSECMTDIFDLMESGAMEEKLFKDANAKLEYDGHGLVEKLSNGKIRKFDNAIITRIERGRKNSDILDSVRYAGYGMVPYQRDYIDRMLYNEYQEVLKIQLELFQKDRYYQERIDMREYEKIKI